MRTEAIGSRWQVLAVCSSYGRVALKLRPLAPSQPFARETEATTDVFESTLCLAFFPHLPSSEMALWSFKVVQRNCGV